MIKGVAEYIDAQASPQKEICRRLREMIRQAFPGIRETMKMGVPWYEDKFYIVALRGKVNLGFAINGLTSEEVALFEGTGKTMRVVEVRSLAEVDEEMLLRLLRMVWERV